MSKIRYIVIEHGIFGIGRTIIHAGDSHRVVKRLVTTADLGSAYQQWTRQVIVDSAEPVLMSRMPCEGKIYDGSAEQLRDHVTPQETADFLIGDRVEAGEPDTEDHDSGCIVEIDDEEVTIAWDSCATTTQRGFSGLRLLA